MPRPPERPATPGGFKRPLGWYAVGHGTLLCGAWAMHATGSMMPMALAASACLMLTLPIVRRVRARALARRRQARRDPL